MSIKEVQDFIEKSTRLHIDKELLDFLVDISLISHKIPAKNLNILLSPSKPYEDLEFRSKDTIGMVNV